MMCKGVDTFKLPEATFEKTIKYRRTLGMGSLYMSS